MAAASPEVDLDAVVAGVDARLAAGRPEAVTAFLNQARVQPDALRPYLHWEPAHYTRNLIARRERFELLALCWGVGHRAWVHNHQGERCWMAVVEGRLRVRNYRRLGCDQTLRTARLEPAAELVAEPGSLAAVDPDEPVHAVWNPAEWARPAVSLHVYARPFDTCVSYDVEAGLCRDVRMAYTSEHTVRTDRHRGGGSVGAVPRCACALDPAEQARHCGALPPG